MLTYSNPTPLSPTLNSDKTNIPNGHTVYTSKIHMLNAHMLNARILNTHILNTHIRNAHILNTQKLVCYV